MKALDPDKKYKVTGNGTYYKYHTTSPKYKTEIPEHTKDYGIHTGAGLMNALEIAGKKIGDCTIVIVGAGAAGIASGRLYKAMGADPEKLKVSFPSIETDVPYRQVTALSQAFQMGGLHREEYRASLLEIMDVQAQKPVSDLPVPDQFNAAHPIPFESDEDEAEANTPDPSDEPVNDPLARQGNSGAVGTVQHDTNFNRQADNGRV